MKTKLLIGAITTLVLGGAGVWLFGQAAPATQIQVRQPQPEVLVKDVPTSVTISAIIPGDVIPGSVNLLRINADGQSSVIGQLNATPSLGANAYSLTTTFRESVFGTVSLQISAAIRGQLRRVMSPMFRLGVSSKSIVLPPDPGEAGKLTLEGIDSDRDGVRDDLQRYIVFSFPHSEIIRAGLTSMALAGEGVLRQSADSAASLRNTELFTKSQQCMEGFLDYMTVRDIKNSFRVELINTKERTAAWFTAQRHTSGQVRGIVLDSTILKSLCTFDPTALEE